ncbi:MAG: GIY-YIG nuclease family protein [Cellulosilyticaceae bacterium]
MNTTMQELMQQLKELLISSQLADLFECKKEDILENFVAYRVARNIYRIRAFELHNLSDGVKFRIYYGDKIPLELKETFKELGTITKGDCLNSLDYKADNYLPLAQQIHDILSNDGILNTCETSRDRAKTSKFEGMALPDVDVTQTEIIGEIFTWRDIIAIWEDASEDNVLKKVLQQDGVYLQRSKDGVSRYVGSAYGENGIIGRWMKHLTSNGNAHHLNLYVLENGYNAIEFTVLELCSGTDALAAESRWKKILSTHNAGPYNGIQLNRN